MYATDSLKALAKWNDTTVAALREQARDLHIAVRYTPARHTWTLDADAATVRMFNEFVAN